MKDLKNYTLLIVDDEDVLRDTIVFDFKRKGFTVLSANCGSVALELVKSNKIDLIVSDMRMPGGDGLTLLEQARACHPELPVLIFITGFADVTEAECLAKGALSVVPKPFDRKLLMNSVIKALELVDQLKPA